MDEEKLIRALRRGEIAAVEEMIIKYGPFVSSVIAGILKGRKQECEELTQDVFLAVWENRKKLEEGKLKPYLAVIARNRAFSLLRKYHEELPLEEDILIYDTEDIQLKIEQRELSRLLDEALEQLPEENRELFVRHYYYGQRVCEAAEIMGVNESTAKSWLKRGREKLKEILLEKGIENEKRTDFGKSSESVKTTLAAETRGKE